MSAVIRALDLFAGTGWGVACQLLGIEEDGVELMDEAVATRKANGMSTIYRDVWDGLLLSREAHELLYGLYTLLIASPPCQTFSMAGNGAGRKALNEVIEAIRLHAYKNPAALLEFGQKHDLRTALVLSPLAYVYRDRPRLVAFEQVPTVLPVWEECAKVMREWGYDVKVAVLNAEQYGVPQTRKRAILVARLDGPVALPTPTHSRYYSRTPEKLDPGVKKWVSMAEALGWGMTDAPMHTITAGTHGPTDRWASGGNGARKRVDEKVGGPNWVHNPNPAPVDSRTQYTERIGVEEAALIQTYPSGRGLTGRPSPTITGGGTETGGAEPIAKYHERYTNAPDWVGSTERLSTDEAAALQTYPSGTVFRNGNQANASKRPLDAPAPTLMFGQRSNKVEWMDPEKADDPSASGERVTVEQAAALQTYPTPLRPEIEDWQWKDAPATTVAGDPRITAREHHYPGEQGKTALKLTKDEASALQTFPGWGFTNRPAVTVGNAVGRGLIGGSGAKRAVVEAIEDGSFIPSVHAQDDSYAEQTRITVPEAGVLQTYGRPFIWCGNKSKQFLQIGNAVPPLLAWHVLSALTSEPVDGMDLI